MDLSSVIAQLEAHARLLRDAGRATFLQLGGATITFGGLSVEEAEAAHRRLAELADTMPVVLVIEGDREEATRLCRTAAQRLTAAPWYQTVTETGPAPIAHELAALAGCLGGAGQGPPSPEAALLHLRDLSETLVKLPAAILARHLIARGGADAEAMRRSLAEVSGGAWNALARDAAERLTRAEPGSKLARVAALFDDGSRYAELFARLATARNNTIGHGALRPNPAETAGCRACRRESLRRHEQGAPRSRAQQALTRLATPREQQALADAMPDGYGTDHRARLVGFSNDPHLVLQAPAPPTLPPGDDLHNAIHPHTSTADLRRSLRRQEAQTLTASAEGYGRSASPRLHQPVGRP